MTAEALLRECKAAEIAAKAKRDQRIATLTTWVSALKEQLKDKKLALDK